ncbi:hypothetical protein [Streptomyces mirabilis]|uniref:hypothetical protein n=1 Tax=Streptomyces mirabilis TaxID=68239 RepID=UPI00365D8760
MSARVAENQLDQSKEQRTEHSMSQASRITAWAEGDNTVVANRSLDPADVYLDALVVGSKMLVVSGPKPQRDLVYVGTVPPCLRLSIRGGLLRSTTLYDMGHTQSDPKNPGPIYVTSIMIVDANGHVWEGSTPRSFLPNWACPLGLTPSTRSAPACSLDVRLAIGEAAAICNAVTGLGFTSASGGGTAATSYVIWTGTTWALSSAGAAPMQNLNCLR